MQFSLFHVIWAAICLAFAFWINGTCAARISDSIDAAYAGDREEAQDLIDGEVGDMDCTLTEAVRYLESPSQGLVSEPEFLKTSVKKIYEQGAVNVEMCEQTIAAYKYASHLFVTLPDDPGTQDDVISEVQSFLRREATVYGGLSASDGDEVEEYVRYGALIGEEQVLVELLDADEAIEE